MLTKLLEGDTHVFEQQLQKFASSLPSYHDVEGTEPETFYHGMMIGLLASLEPAYEVRSNNDHAAELRAAGVEKIQQMVVAFDGKRVMVLPKGAPAPKKERAKSGRNTTKKTAKKATKTRR